MPEASMQAAATDGAFEARIEAVRKRFAAKFVDRMQQTITDLPGMTGDGAVAADIVAHAYHWLHQISGIAATIGFESTGQSARSCDDLLIGPYRAQRGLSAAELAQLTNRLDSLRRAAQGEMHIPG
jgi:HPt (histidine-containing phosphotransfer) domain-containing protein